MLKVTCKSLFVSAQKSVLKFQTLQTWQQPARGTFFRLHLFSSSFLSFLALHTCFHGQKEVREVLGHLLEAVSTHQQGFHPFIS